MPTGIPSIVLGYRTSGIRHFSGILIPHLKSVGRKPILSAFSRGLLTCENNVAVPSRIPTPVFNYTQDENRLRQCKHTDVPVLLNTWKTYTSELIKIGTDAQEFLGLDKFSIKSSLKDVFGSYNEIINLFTLRNSHEEHPFNFLARLLQAEASYRDGALGINPFPLWRSMMTLLVTEMFGVSQKLQETRIDAHKITADRNFRHGRMAKITEIAYITQQIHKRILDSESFHLPDSTNNKALVRRRTAELHDANKTATLVGDLLWSQICVHMAELKCQVVSELICEFLMDYCVGEYVFRPKAAPLGQFNTEAWFRKTQLGLGSIMGTTISSTLAFSGHDEQIRNDGYKLGMLLALTYQAYDDIIYFTNENLDTPHWLDLSLLPVVHKISKDPSMLNEEPLQIFHKVRKDEQIFTESCRTLRILQEDTLMYMMDMEKNIVSQRSRDILERFILSLFPSTNFLQQL